jgi:hypothetical protein
MNTNALYGRFIRQLSAAKKIDQQLQNNLARDRQKLLLSCSQAKLANW